jgi:NAD(P)-dependent dehydrogenase (short-subunit alcohol dehydrogenase family)
VTANVAAVSISPSKGSHRVADWTFADVPSQSGRTAVITGASSGVGFATAWALAGRGARVVMAVRNLERGAHAVARITAAHPGAIVELVELDLTSLRSIAVAAAQIRIDYDRIDLLINNAGVMWTPKATTVDGFELQFATNHLGHFALTGLLLERMLPVADSRVVTVSSGAHRIRAGIHFDDLQWERRYDRVGAYGQSKLANLLFTYELQRRLAPLRRTAAVAAHPGVANTGLSGHLSWVSKTLLHLAVPLRQDLDQAALPTLRAATDVGVLGGQYYGPGGFGEMRGYPTVVDSSRQSHDAELQRRLWAVSEQLTGMVYRLG